MAILDVGFTEVVEFIADKLDKGIAGTGTAAISTSQTGLVTPVAATEADLIVTKGTNTISTEFSIAPTTGNGSTFYEWGQRFTDGTYFTRGLTAGVSKTASDQIVVKQITYIRRG